MYCLWHAYGLLTLLFIGANCDNCGTVSSDSTNCDDYEVATSYSTDFFGIKYNTGRMRMRNLEDGSTTRTLGYNQTLEDPIANVMLEFDLWYDYSREGFENYRRRMYLYHDKYGKFSLVNGRETKKDRKWKGNFQIDCLGLSASYESGTDYNDFFNYGKIQAKSKMSSPENQEFIPLGTFKRINIYDYYRTQNKNDTFTQKFEQIRQRFKVPASRKNKWYKSTTFSSDVLSFENTFIGFGRGAHVESRNITCLYPEFSSFTTTAQNMGGRDGYGYSVTKSELLTVVTTMTRDLRDFGSFDASLTAINNDGKQYSLVVEVTPMVIKATIEVPTEAWSLSLVLTINQTITLTAYENDHFINRDKLLLELEFYTTSQDSESEESDDRSYQYYKDSGRARVVKKDFARISELLGTALSKIKNVITQYVGIDNASNRTMAGMAGANRTIVGMVADFLRTNETTGVDQRCIEVITDWFQKRLVFFEQKAAELATATSTADIAVPDDIGILLFYRQRSVINPPMRRRKRSSHRRHEPQALLDNVAPLLRAAAPLLFVQ